VTGHEPAVVPALGIAQMDLPKLRTVGRRLVAAAFKSISEPTSERTRLRGGFFVILMPNGYRPREMRSPETRKAAPKGGRSRSLAPRPGLEPGTCGLTVQGTPPAARTSAKIRNGFPTALRAGPDAPNPRRTPPGGIVPRRAGTRAATTGCEDFLPNLRRGRPGRAVGRRAALAVGDVELSMMVKT